MTSFLRTTGGKGLHVVVLLTRRSNWQDVKNFSGAIARSMAHDSPELYVATASKAKRRRRVFIDYLRNCRSATAICSYSTRSHPGATVATPVGWRELGARLKPDKYAINNLPKRLVALRTDPWEDFFSVRQSITLKMKRALDI